MRAIHGLTARVAAALAGLVAIGLVNAQEDVLKEGDPIPPNLKEVLKRAPPDKREGIRFLFFPKPFDIGGFVLDGDGRPVQDAEVKLSWHYMSVLTLNGATHEEIVRTGADGRFTVTVKAGGDIHVREATKDGYEWRYDLNPLKSQNGGMDEEPRLLDKTAVYYLRKRGRMTYLHEASEVRLAFAPTGGRAGLMCPVDRGDERKSFRADPTPEELRKLGCAVLVNSTFSEEKQAYLVSFSVPWPGGGILERPGSEMRYSAPAGEYLPELTLEIPLNLVGTYPTPYRCLYVKSQSPLLYSRMDIHMNADKMQIRFRIKVWTNLYGNGNFENAPGVSYYLQKHLFEEARKAYAKGEYPPEPDIKKLIAGWKDPKQ
jgi:hypothetical protein